MKTYGRFVLAFGLLVLFRYVAFAQLPALSIDPVQAELQAVSIFGNQSHVAVTGAPYSAIEERLYSQRQPGGTYEDRSLITTHIYRDWQGRTRAERYVTSYLPGAGESKLTSIFIADPLAGVLYRLDPENHTAAREPLNVNTQVLSADANAAGQVRSTGELQLHATTESLGNSTMEGLTVEGTRQTLTVPVGARDNDRPFKVVVETWTSPELKVVVFSERDNSVVGMNTTRLTKIDRSEPDPALFQVPLDYKIEDAQAEGSSHSGTAH
jgi:hypothetical protein